MDSRKTELIELVNSETMIKNALADHIIKMNVEIDGLVNCIMDYLSDETFGTKAKLRDAIDRMTELQNKDNELSGNSGKLNV